MNAAICSYLKNISFNPKCYLRSPIWLQELPCYAIFDYNLRPFDVVPLFHWMEDAPNLDANTVIRLLRSRKMLIPALFLGLLCINSCGPPGSSCRWFLHRMAIPAYPHNTSPVRIQLLSRPATGRPSARDAVWLPRLAVSISRRLCH